MAENVAEYAVLHDIVRTRHRLRQKSVTLLPKSLSDVIKRKQDVRNGAPACGPADGGHVLAPSQHRLCLTIRRLRCNTDVTFELSTI